MFYEITPKVQLRMPSEPNPWPCGCRGSHRPGCPFRSMQAVPGVNPDAPIPFSLTSKATDLLSFGKHVHYFYKSGGRWVCDCGESR